MSLKIFILCICIFTCGFTSEYDVVVKEYGRRIQLDGFLIEWNAKSANLWKNTQNWYYDILNTPEGLAGYIRSDSSLGCKEWFFTFDLSKSKNLNIVVPSGEKDFYKQDRKLYDSLGLISIEWLIPWNEIEIDNSGKYTLSLTGVSRYGDSLTALKIIGKQNSSTEKSFSLFNFVLQSLLILILVVIYIMLTIRIRKRQKSSQIKKS